MIKLIDFLTLLKNELLFFALLIPGYIMGKRGRIDERISNGITDILTDISMPFLIFSKLIETNVSSLNASELIVSFTLPAIVIISLYLISGIFFKSNGDARFAAMFSNCAFLGLPLAVTMFPDSPKVAVLIAFYNVTSTVLFLTFGIYILSRDKKNINLKSAILKPISIATILGVTLSLFNIGEKLPMLITFSEFPAQLATPLSMILLGYELSKLKIRDILKIRDVYFASLVKLVISPILTIIILLISEFIGLTISPELAASMFLSTGVAIAATVPSMTRRYGTYPELSAQLTMSSTLFCILTLPIMSLILGIFF